MPKLKAGFTDAVIKEQMARRCGALSHCPRREPGCQQRYGCTIRIEMSIERWPEG